MELASDLIKQFVDATNDSKSSTKIDKTLNATAVVNEDGVFVKIDGSTVTTPVVMAADVRNGDRVLVTIENHQANIIGNISSPASGRGASDLYAETLKEDGSIEPSGSLAPAKVFVDTLTAKNVTADSILADSAKIKKLETEKISATDADLKYAKIDFANIDEAAMEYFYSKSGLIKNVTVGDQTITGELIGVTIKGDLIEGGTVKADKLVIKGEDGLFYKLNVDALGETTASSDKKYQNGLDGSAIIAKSITAEQISVKDLVAFGATIGGFKIGDDSIYSGVKSTVNNTTRGIYLDNDGQFSFGDNSNFIKFYKDTDGKYRLKISAESLEFGSSGSSVEEEISNLKDEISTQVIINSSQGTTFKNNDVSTVLNIIIIRGTQYITDMTTLRAAMGNSVHLQWKYQKPDEDGMGVILSSDTRLKDEGFTFIISPDDVDERITFFCELMR
jgi:hypothetical protein